jgi:hypothetical protein
MALRDIRLRPYVWSIRQALAWGAVLGVPCGFIAWLAGWRPVASPPGMLPDLVLALLVAAALSALLVACAALVRNMVTRLVYRRQKLETLRGAVWARDELAVAGALCFAVLLPAMAAASRLLGWTVSDLHLLLAVPLAAVVGGLYLPLVGLLRRVWIARRQL